MEPKRGFTKDELNLLAKEQLNLEIDSNITIKSIQKFSPCDSTVLNYVNIYFIFIIISFIIILFL